MFERYTEKARRVIFFARYEASQYGSRYIESEHMLLGLLREDRALMRRVIGRDADSEHIRKEIEKTITRRERISTSVEVPLSHESKQMLMLAAEEANAFHDRHVGTEHVLLAILMTEGSLAARILTGMGVKPAPLRELMAKASASARASVKSQTSNEAIIAVNAFLAGLEATNWSASAHFFASNIQIIDSKGKCWRGRDEIEKHFEALFVPYTKRDVTFLLESLVPGPPGSFVGSVLWKDVIVPGETTRSMHRMSVLVAQEGGDWAIFLLQVTRVVFP
jgi:hypothetical protein